MDMISLLILIEDFCWILALEEHQGPAGAMPQDMGTAYQFCARLETLRLLNVSSSDMECQHVNSMLHY